MLHRHCPRYCAFIVVSATRIHYLKVKVNSANTTNIVNVNNARVHSQENCILSDFCIWFRLSTLCIVTTGEAAFHECPRTADLLWKVSKSGLSGICFSACNRSVYRWYNKGKMDCCQIYSQLRGAVTRPKLPSSRWSLIDVKSHCSAYWTYQLLSIQWTTTFLLTHCTTPLASVTKRFREWKVLSSVVRKESELETRTPCTPKSTALSRKAVYLGQSCSSCTLRTFW